MDWIYGVSRCWSLSRTCGIDWEAWSAILTGLVGLLAWRTAREAKEISEKATQIAEAQHREVQDQRDATARILARLLIVEISSMPPKIEGALIVVRGTSHSFDQVIFGKEPFPLRVGEIALNLVSKFEQIQLPGSELAEPRLHTLPISIGNQLSILISSVREFRAAAPAVNEQVVSYSERCYYKSRNGPETMRYFDVILLDIYEQAVTCAQSLQEYVEMAVQAYPSMDAL